MNCPHCNANTKVIDCRIYPDYKSRRRECKGPTTHRFTTYETLELTAHSFLLKHSSEIKQLTEELSKKIISEIQTLIDDDNRKRKETRGIDAQDPGVLALQRHQGID